ncbi:hypothetical protein SUGI_0224630 [Cryptomeria japonica]|uniref:TMV resistance protein N n=1 Tax=Cryptomeria japonica TaxID=3369 RepID=UPI0024089CB9|nr:TMV resistance protein N [Cryptomeria japonica]GLJ14045.1 hypothetical protein SUGI_0224630 [Cryptomeria japonica]
MASSSSARPLNLDENAFGEMLYKGEKMGSSASPKVYDVFINHRGPDVKQTLALELYNSLEKVGIRAFLDCKEMDLGDLFPSTIQNAICSSSVQIAIFSRRYAESVWCLAELALMLQTKRKIIPIFYDVPPFHLRYLEKGVYADSFNYHTEKRRYLDKLDGWKENLRCVSFMSGYEFNNNNENFATLCKNIVSAVRREVERRRPLEIARYPTGMEELVEDFERACWQKEEKGKVMGIYGMGGSGKTTLAKELFNQKRSEFSASCFLFDVRESKLTYLQTKLLKDLVQENHMFDSIPEGSSYLKSRLAYSPFVSFLIVMDDIDHLDQLNALLVNNSGSMIIVTTRDERVLIRAEINCRYKMKEMNVHHSTELFCWHAFHQPYPTSGYEDLVESFVKECGGLPLSLQVLGGHVFGSAGKHYWRLELDKVRKTLKQDIKKKLRISLESLDDEQMQVFLDIACFFVNKSRYMALRIMEGSGWSAEHTLQILMDKCLVEVQVGRSYWNGFESESFPLLTMHDHTRDLGREIADYELSSPSRLWRSQYLRSQEEKGFESILAGMSGHSFRCLNSIFDQYTTLQFRYFLGNVNDCEDSTSLLWLEIDSSMLEKQDEHENIEGEFMSSMSSSHTIPSWIPLQNLQYLKIYQGSFQRLWRRDHQVPLQLKDLILDGTNLEEFPNPLGMLSHLENLVLAGRVKWNGRE